ncbi:glycine zipper family protein [Dehalogenimonas alkenigignens]|uniref:Glycine zipper n=2 Tax=Dehalogenimonas alkenigignens TaxID=1217799 RepID=A0A0W0GG42_9CHLR|nr:hypothetical protein DEALK_03480 [Dehalogenimonas alkenigignens]PVV83439.1 glycine zipper family protein [Dehalogenimonas alkenigignens]
MVVRIDRRLGGLANACTDCPGHHAAVGSLLEKIESVDSWSIDEWKVYYRSLDAIITHLKRAHRLAEEGDGLGAGMVVGAGIGTVAGLVFGNIGVGLALGSAIGLFLGAIGDAIAHKQGRVI